MSCFTTCWTTHFSRCTTTLRPSEQVTSLCTAIWTHVWLFCRTEPAHKDIVPTLEHACQRRPRGHHGRCGGLLWILHCSVPHGRRLLHKLTYVHWTLMPDGSWQREETIGTRPPSGIGGPRSGSTALRSCCWTWHLLETKLESVTVVRRLEVRRLQHGSADAFRAGRTVASENRVGSRSHRVRRQHSELRLDQAEGGRRRQCPRWPSRTKCGPMRPSQARRPLSYSHPGCRYGCWIWYCTTWSGTQRRSTCHEKRDAGLLTWLTQATTEVPVIFWISLFPHRKILRRVQHHGRLPAKCLRVP